MLERIKDYFAMMYVAWWLWHNAIKLNPWNIISTLHNTGGLARQTMRILQGKDTYPPGDPTIRMIHINNWYSPDEGHSNSPNESN